MAAKLCRPAFKRLATARRRPEIIWMPQWPYTNPTIITIHQVVTHRFFWLFFCVWWTDRLKRRNSACRFDWINQNSHVIHSSERNEEKELHPNARTLLDVAYRGYFWLVLFCGGVARCKHVFKSVRFLGGKLEMFQHLEKRTLKICFLSNPAGSAQKTTKRHKKHVVNTGGNKEEEANTVKTGP